MFSISDQYFSFINDCKLVCKWWYRMGGMVLWFYGVFNATFNNISYISWQSVLLVEETEDPEKTTDLPQLTDKFYLIMLYTSPSPWEGFELTTSVVIGTDYIGSRRSNYHTIIATKAPGLGWDMEECFIRYNLKKMFRGR